MVSLAGEAKPAARRSISRAIELDCSLCADAHFGCAWRNSGSLARFKVPALACASVHLGPGRDQRSNANRGASSEGWLEGRVADPTRGNRRGEAFEGAAREGPR